MKILTGFLLCLLLVFVLGAIYSNSTWIGGWLSTPPYYEGQLSGVGQNGECYFAMTSTLTGRTEIIKIPTSEPNQTTTQQYFNSSAFEKGRDGRIIFTPDRMKEIEYHLKDMRNYRPQ